MPLQRRMLMLIGTLPMNHCGEATPDEGADLQPIRTITPLIDRLRTATRVATGAATGRDAKERMP